MNRRQFLLSAAALGLSSSAVAGIRLWPETGFTNQCLSGLPDELKNHPLMEQIWKGVDASQVWDCHAHIIGAGNNGSGAWFNPNMESWMHPILKVQKNFYMNGGCIVERHEDESFVTRMTQLAREMPAGYKTMLFAFDWFRDEQGVADSKSSIFHVPNEYAFKVANQYPQHFEWVASIHPYRPDAIDALERAHSEGACAVKWLPTGMNIDPAYQNVPSFTKNCMI